jgi:hypothetical protein
MDGARRSAGAAAIGSSRDGGSSESLGGCRPAPHEEEPMKLCTLSWTRSGWNQPWLPALDSEQTLVLVFAAPEFADDGTALEELRRAYPRATFAGGSTSGEILGASVNDGSLVAAVARFERTRLRAATATLRATDGSDGDASHAAGGALARELAAPDLRGVFVVCDGIHVDGEALVRGLTGALPEPVVVTGGLAGDGDRFHDPWVLVDRRPRANGVVAVGLYGDAVRIEARDGAVVFAEQEAGAGAGELLAVSISGVGRRSALRGAAATEAAAVLAALPHGTQQIGFYSYGAIAPDAGSRRAGASGATHLQHSTMRVTTLSEA